MAHRTSLSVYERLTERLNRCSQGAPPSESLFRILKILFSEREAALVSVLPLKPFTAAKAAAIWKTPARRLLATEQVRSRYLEALIRRRQPASPGPRRAADAP